ncbi:DUF4926 domain-containing protein [Saccharopolyspora phatthalungensis]|uniref:DUF4926 domain-containing protein n=1 Tax=Saccharopolyspora phatthalungensis TaxID=664693 RepID=A0A840QGF6_9PSEU|nr:DUF4926 domain-containing protein [Saccharopolyspora phatthalungensis]MBB5159040.1 hypothetical protein [Saccharopolyspora phatthalungensis]
MLELYSRVRITTDKFLDEDNVPAGAVGYIVECYPDGNYEVEVSDDNGHTIGQFVATEADLK